MSHTLLCAVEQYKNYEEYYIHLIIFNSYLSFQTYANEQNCVFDNEYTCSKYNDDFYNLYFYYFRLKLKKMLNQLSIFH